MWLAKALVTLIVTTSVAAANAQQDPVATAAAVRAFEAALSEVSSGATRATPEAIAQVATVISAPPILATREALAVLLQQIEHAAPVAGDVNRSSSAAREAALRQALALAYLPAVLPPDEMMLVLSFLRGGRLWEPWRAARILGASGDAELLQDLRALLDDYTTGLPAREVTLAIATLGNPAGAVALEEFLRARYGTKEYSYGKDALIQLARRGEAQREAVSDVTIALLRLHPRRTRVDAGITWQEDHPARVRVLQGTAMDILRAVGTAAGAAVLRDMLAKLAASDERVIAFAQQTVDIVLSRELPK
jgi:hypothetical protein